MARDGRVKLMVADNIGYYARQEPVIRRAVGGMSTFFTGCMAGCLAVCIQSDGSVKGCPTHPDSFVVGELRKESFAAIWADEARFAYNTRWDESKLVGECATCPFRRVCRAGCTSMAYAVTGTIYDNPYCVQRVK
jgi:radical SAM protein with 4Fe4S-binding SPASM domain